MGSKERKTLFFQQCHLSLPISRADIITWERTISAVSYAVYNSLLLLLSIIEKKTSKKKFSRFPRAKRIKQQKQKWRSKSGRLLQKPRDMLLPDFATLFFSHTVK
jgi:hypothetical protein